MKISIQTEMHLPPQSKVENVFTQSLKQGVSESGRRDRRSMEWAFIEVSFGAVNRG